MKRATVIFAPTDLGSEQPMTYNNVTSVDAYNEYVRIWQGEQTSHIIPVRRILRVDEEWLDEPFQARNMYNSTLPAPTQAVLAGQRARQARASRRPTRVVPPPIVPDPAATMTDQIIEQAIRDTSNTTTEQGLGQT